MTKTEYMEKLKEKLEQFNRSLQDEILEDYEQHFAEGLSEGKSEEKIIAELGDIEDMIQEFDEEDYKQEVIPCNAEEKPGPGEEPKDRRYGQEYRRQVSGENYRAIVIDCDVADLNLEESGDGRFYAECEIESEALREIYSFYQYEEDKVCYVGVRRKEGTDFRKAVRINLFGKTILAYHHDRISGGDIRLDIKVPAGCPRVQIKTRSGDIQAYQLHVGEFELSSISGDVGVQRIFADTLKLTSTSGDMSLYYIRGKELCLHSTSGDWEIDDVEVDQLKAQTASGGIRFDRMQARRIELGTGSGDIEGSSADAEEVAVGVGSGDVELSMDACVYRVKTGSGDVELRAAQRAQIVEVGTGSGDASVDVTAVAGVEISATAGSGDIQINRSGEEYHEKRSCHYLYGDGSCRVRVSTGSGDIDVNCR